MHCLQSSLRAFLFYRYTILPTTPITTIMGYFNEKYIQVFNPCFFSKLMVSHLKHYKLKININMFWVKRNNSQIQQEIKDFAYSRRNYSTTSNHVRYLNHFIRMTGIQSFDDVTENDIESYIKTVHDTISSKYQKESAIQALNLFMLFKKNEAEKRKRGQPQKLERNEKIFQLRLTGLSYGDIAKKYHLNKKTVYSISKRFENND